MNCRYCRAKNRGSAEECVVCGKPFPKLKAGQSDARRFPEAAPHAHSKARRTVRVLCFGLTLTAAMAAGAIGTAWVDDNGGPEAAYRKLLARAVGSSPAASSTQPMPANRAIARPAENPPMAEKPPASAPKISNMPRKPMPSTQRVARGREISRIRQQAADELKKKD